jgi:hypothetical protein
MRRDGVEDEARVLRDAIRGLGRTHPTEEIPQELRTRIVEFTRLAKTSGWSMDAVARAIGVSVGSIRNWRRDPAGAAALLPVTVVRDRKAAASGFQVVGPSGYRVEGLDLPAAVALLRALE